MSKIEFPDSVPDDFWQIIEDAGQNRPKFRELLKTMNRGKINRFFWTYEELANRIRTETYWRYADPDLSEDGISELANWVVAQGRNYYRNVLEHPEKMPASKDDIGYVSDLITEYENRYNTDIAVNTHIWDDDWKLHGKKSPWSHNSN